MVSIDSSFLMNHTCLRIKDPKESVDFYTKNFGMKLLKKVDFSEKNFTLYMMGFDDGSNKNWAAREGVLELCHNHGVENDPNFKLNNGNGDKLRGFGHICVSVDNIEEAERQLLSSGATFQKKLSDGRQKNIAFVLDPNGYWIELIEHGKGKKPSVTDKSTYQFNHTMIRIKDPKRSLDFYRNVLGMKLFSTRQFPEAKFDLYFLGYDHSQSYQENKESIIDQAGRQSIIELTHNYGTESDPNFEGYHNGNSGDFTGYGHTCVSCEDPAKLCKEIETEYPDVQWSLKFDQGFIKKIAFVKDPDDYSIEIFGHDLLADK